jgi:membrane protein DedA with SNARE-associated domain
VLALLNPTSLVASSGYAAIFLLCVAQSCCVPTSSELTMGFAGVLAAEGRLGLPQVIVVGAVGELLGAYVAWFIGRMAGRAVVDRYGKYLLLSHRDLDRAEAWYDRHPRFGVLGSRLLPVIRNFVALPAGIAEVPLARFGILTFIGSLIWDAAMALIGYSVGQRWQEVMKGFNDAGYVLAVLVVAAVAVFIWHRWHAYRAATAAEGAGAHGAPTSGTGTEQLDADGSVMARSRPRGRHLAGTSRPDRPAPSGLQLPKGVLRVRQPSKGPAPLPRRSAPAPERPPAPRPETSTRPLADAWSEPLPTGQVAPVGPHHADRPPAEPPEAHERAAVDRAPFDWAASGDEPTRIQPALAAEAPRHPADQHLTDRRLTNRHPAEEPTTVHSALGRLQPAPKAPAEAPRSPHPPAPTEAPSTAPSGRPGGAEPAATHVRILGPEESRDS